MPNSHTGSKAVNYPGIAAEVMEAEPLTVSRAIAGDVLGEIDVDTLNPVLGLYGREDVLALRETKVAPGGTYPRSRSETDDVVGQVEKFGHEKDMTLRQLIGNRTSGRADRVQKKGRICYGALVLRREYRVSNSIFNTTTWDSTDSDLYTDASDWGTPGSSTPIADVSAAKQKVRGNTGVEPNALIVSAATMENLLAASKITGRFNADVISEDLLRRNMASIFGLDQLIVGSAVYNTAAAGQNFSGSEVWSSDYAMVARVATSDIEEEPCLGRTLRLRARLQPDQPDVSLIDTREGIEIMTYWEDREDTLIVRAREWLDEMILDKYMGHLMYIGS